MQRQSCVGDDIIVLCVWVMILSSETVLVMWVIILNSKMVLVYVGDHSRWWNGVLCVCDCALAGSSSTAAVLRVDTCVEFGEIVCFSEPTYIPDLGDLKIPPSEA